jgi:hypothetical protein
VVWRLRQIQRRHQLRRRGQPIGQVADDDRVGARIDLHLAPRRQGAAGDDRNQLAGLGVTERPRQHAKLTGQRLLVGQLAALHFFFGEDAERRDAHDRSVDEVAEFVGLEDDVERLIPRHVAQGHVDGAGNGRVDHHVEAADLSERAQDGAQIGALEVE